MLARILRRDTRRAPRFEIDIPSRLRSSARASNVVEVENLSSRGLRGIGEIGARRGDWVSIEVPELGPLAARIAWIKGDRFGAIFAKPVEIEALVNRRRGLVEIVAGLTIRLEESRWTGDFPRRPKSPSRGVETEEERAERIARTTRQVQQHIEELKRRRACGAQAVAPDDEQGGQADGPGAETEHWLLGVQKEK